MKARALLPLLLLLWPGLLLADEGLWLLPLLQKQNAAAMRQLGLQLDLRDIYSEQNPALKDAIVLFGRGCTGEVISHQGLVITNHHCGYGAIQQHSSPQHDYLQEGFVAKSLQEEIPTPGLTVTFLVSIRNITHAVEQGLSDTLDLATRQSLLQTNQKNILDSLTRTPNHDYQITSYFANNLYYLLEYVTFSDVRMVFAPPSSIGKFGADSDNWEYPRHTGDFSIFRIYADANNNPAPYSPSNRPYKPKKWLNVSLDGYKEGDFTMILGYPYSTNRYATSWEVEQIMNYRNTPRAYLRGIKQEVWKKHMAADQAVRIKYASKYASSANYWKNAIGQNEALQRNRVVEKKQQRELDLMNWCGQHPDYNQKCTKALYDIETTTKGLNEAVRTYFYIYEGLFQGVELCWLAPMLKDLPQLLEQKDQAKVDSLVNRLIDQKKAYEGFYKNYDAPTALATAKVMMATVKQDLKEEDLPQVYQLVDKEAKGDINAYLDNVFTNSFLASYDRFLDFLKKPSLKKLQADPGWQMISSIFTSYELAYYASLNKQQRGLEPQRHDYVATLLAMEANTPHYPDANATMRLTYGTVKSYNPRDAVHYNYYTTLKGVMEKEDPNRAEFNVDPKLKELYRLQDYDQWALPNGEMPVNFLTTNDITGGNSGSPILDKRGNLLGLAFDGNWESLSGDMFFEPDLQRCIGVDIRYVLFIVQRWGNAQRLIDEIDFVHVDEAAIEKAMAEHRAKQQQKASKARR